VGQHETDSHSLADDHTIICDGFRKLFEPEYEVVASVADGRALLKAAEEMTPDVALVDIGMPLTNELDAARQLKQRMPTAKTDFPHHER
jgi:DNA-binding NarL/FixJ family response regulator